MGAQGEATMDIGTGCGFAAGHGGALYGIGLNVGHHSVDGDGLTLLLRHRRGCGRLGGGSHSGGVCCGTVGLDGDGAAQTDVVRGAAYAQFKVAGLHDAAHLAVVERQVVHRHTEGKAARLAGSERHLIESLEFLHGVTTEAFLSRT